MRPWLEAASEFELNTDFDVDDELTSEPMPLHAIMAVMKSESRDKRTIQALADKILLHGMIDNLGVQQMPFLFSSYGTVNAGQVEKLVDTLERSGDDQAFDIVAKPTHLSNSSGSLVLTNGIWHSYGYTADSLVSHMETYLAEKAHSSESEALQSLRPGFIVQPCYKSSPDFGFPIEIRVITLWGKTRLGIWWFGPKCNDPKIKWERNAWMVQQGNQPGEPWQVIREGNFQTPEYEQGLQLVLQAMPTMASSAERIAKAVGTPFLRSDFFVGSSKWGIRLNEVAYGSNIELRKLANGPLGFADDSPDVARILQEGFKRCRRKSPEHFLKKLGVQGNSYEPEWWRFWDQTSPGMSVVSTRRRTIAAC
jgi:hypothetical protein